MGGPSPPTSPASPTSNLGASGSFYQPTGQGAADTQAQSLFGNMGSYQQFGNVLPGLESYYNSTQNNPYATGAQGYSNQAGTVAGNIGTGLSSLGTGGVSQADYLLGALSGGNPAFSDMLLGAQQGGSALQGVGGLDLANAGSIQGVTSGMAAPSQSYAGMTGQALPQIAQSTTSSLLPTAMQNYGTQMGAADTALNAAFDPLNAQYNQQYQQNTDATGANLAAAGLGTSGTGVGILDNSQQNFNNQWTTAQQGREQAGLSAYDTAANSALGNLNTAASTTNNALQSALNSGASNINTAATTGVNAALNSTALANTVGTAGAQNIISGAAQPYNAYQTNISNDTSNLGALGTVASTYGNLGQAGSNDLNVAGQLPYGTSTGILNNQLAGATNLQNAGGTANTINSSQIQSLLNYLGQGTASASNFSSALDSLYNSQINSYSAQNTAQSGLLSGLGSLLGAATGSGGLGSLSSLFGSSATTNPTWLTA